MHVGHPRTSSLSSARDDGKGASAASQVSIRRRWIDDRESERRGRLVMSSGGEKTIFGNAVVYSYRNEIFQDGGSSTGGGFFFFFIH